MPNRRDATELWTDLRRTRYAREMARALLSAALARVGAATQVVLDALLESRRRQAAREIARHRHLIESITSRNGRLPRESRNG
jgi:hypothetical protein